MSCNERGTQVPLATCKSGSIGISSTSVSTGPMSIDLRTGPFLKSTLISMGGRACSPSRIGQPLLPVT